MCAAVANTNLNDDDEGDIDPSNNFGEWLRAKGAQQSLIKKLLKHNIEIDTLREIDPDDKNELNSIVTELQLSTLEKLKFKTIIRNIPNKKLNIVIDREERKAILNMQKKLKLIEISMDNINKTKKKIENDVQKCRKLIMQSYDNIINKLNEKKEFLLIELQNIAKQKMNELDKKYTNLKRNSSQTTKHINTCHSSINKSINLSEIDERKDNILKIAKIVKDFEIVDQNHKLIANCNINFFENNIDDLMNEINKFGHFKSIKTPILVSLQNKDYKLNIKWKLNDNNNNNDNKENEINKLKIEWREVVNDINNNNDMKFDDLKVDINWNNKIFDINNNNKNEINIKLNKKGNYLIRLKVGINDKYSKYSNIKAIFFEKIKTFLYKNDFDKNGLLFALGTSFGKSKYKNPATNGQLNVKWSGLGKGYKHDMVGRKSTTAYTKNKHPSWFSVHLANYKIRVTHYTIRNTSDDEEYHLTNWELQGSKDKTNWLCLKRHIDYMSLSGSSTAKTWVLKDIKEYYQHFRVWNNKKNNGGDWCTYCSGLELYGDVTKV